MVLFCIEKSFDHTGSEIPIRVFALLGRPVPTYLRCLPDVPRDADRTKNIRVRWIDSRGTVIPHRGEKLRSVTLDDSMGTMIFILGRIVVMGHKTAQDRTQPNPFVPGT